MVTKSKTGSNKGKVKVGKLNLNKETVKDLTPDEKKQIKGGLTLVTPVCAIVNTTKIGVPARTTTC